MPIKVMCHEVVCRHNKGLFCRCRSIELPFVHMQGKVHSCYKFKPIEQEPTK